VAAHYLDARQKVEAAKRDLADAQASLDTTESYLLSALDAAGLKSIRLNNGELITASQRIDYRIPGERDLEILHWLSCCGGKPLIKKTVAWQTFSGWCGERVKAGKSIHPAVAVSTRRVVSVRKGD
jgi:hypothetical protein